MRIILFSLLVLLDAASCAQRAMRLPKQGVTGYILEVSGNQMPSPDRPTSKGRGVSREVCIYTPTAASQAQGAAPLFNSIKTQLIATTRSDSTGRYQINLPPGKYSIFIKDNGGFFASETDGNGVFNPIEVQPNTLIHKDVTLNHRAAY